MRILSLLVLFLLGVQIQAQKRVQVQKVDTLSISKLIDNFNKYKLKEASYNINQYDYIVKHQEAEKEYFEVSPLKALKGIQVRNCRGEWYMSHENNQFHLYLTKIVPLNGSTKESADKLYLSLKQKYGEVASKGIPAKWVNGKYVILFWLRNLFGEIVTQDESILNFQNGIQITEMDGLSRGEMEKPKIENGTFPIIGGGWDRKAPLHMRYLSRFVNGCRTVRSDSDAEKKFTLLLFTDLKGKTQVICLNKKEVIDANRVILDDLKKCISELPINSYGHMRTLQGKTFQGRYLIGTYIGNLGWFFTDYINHP